MQRFAEMVVLSLVVAAFVVVGARSAAVIKSALHTLAAAEAALVDKSAAAAADQHGGRELLSIVELTNSAKLVAEASSKGRRMQVKIVRTFVFIFATCLLRSSFSFFFGIISSSQDFDNPCSPNQCHACKNESSHIIFWLLYTPALQMFIVLVSSTLPHSKSKPTCRNVPQARIPPGPPHCAVGYDGCR